MFEFQSYPCLFHKKKRLFSLEKNRKIILFYTKFINRFRSSILIPFRDTLRIPSLEKYFSILEITSLALPKWPAICSWVRVIVSPPLLLGVGGWVIGKIKNAPFVFHVQDLQPDAAVGLGMLKANWFVRVLYALESFIYRHANLVSGITRGMLDRFRSKGVSEERLFYFPNTIALDGASPPPVRGEFRRRYGYRLDEFLAIYAGNIGAKQDLEILVQTASLLTDQRIRIIICGDGAQRDPLTRRIEELKLPNIRMLPLQVGSDYRALLIDVDVCLITQHAGGGNSFFPSKLLGLLAELKAVVTVASPQCELALAVTEGKFGINVPPGHPEELADLLQSLARHPERLAEYGGAGRRYVEQFARENVLREFTDKLELLGR